MSATSCPRCGAALAPENTQGLCPGCLLQAAAGVSAAHEVVITRQESQRPVAPSIEALAPHFPGLEIEALIAVGGMGSVYKARQKSLGRNALKVLHAQIAGEPGFAERFQREAHTMASLSHTGLVGVHDFGQAGPHFHFVMEFVDGVNLRQMLRAKTLSPELALRIVPQVCEVLQYAHDHGVVHRDIKPENILVERGGRVKVLDFGLSKLVGKDPDRPLLTRSDQVMGTPHYMAPEQWEKPLSVDHRADIYSLGVVFYELLTGELPLGRFAPPSHKVHIDVRLDEVVLRTLDKEPTLRYQQASELKCDLDHISETAAAEVPPTPAPPPIPPGSQAALRNPAPTREPRAGANAAPVSVGANAPRAAQAPRSARGGRERLPVPMIALILFYAVSLVVMLIVLLSSF
jgi:serine/threonine protein kinase